MTPGRTAGRYPWELRKPIFVDIYAPAFLTGKERKTLMVSLAEALARHTGYTTNEVFISLCMMEKSETYIMGAVVTNWKQVGGPDK